MSEESADKGCRFCGNAIDDPVETKHGTFCREYCAEMYGIHNTRIMRLLRRLGLEHI